MYTSTLDSRLLIETYSEGGFCLEGYYQGKPSTISGLYAKGCVIVDRSNKKLWQNDGDCDNVNWVDITAGGGGGSGVTSLNGLTGAVTLSEGQNITLNESGSDIEINANFTQEGKYMISGGATWSGTGLTYDVSTLTYFFNGNKTASPTSITLDASDPTDNRFDAIVVDEAGVITKITGTPSMNPEQPAIPSDQLAVQYILVEAASTEPTIASEDVYLDDPTSGWTFSTYTTATPATGTINFAGTNSPKQGVNDIEASTDLRLGARFVRATSFDAFQYTMFQVWVRFTGTAVATNKSLNVRFENSAGTLVGNTINLFNYGLQRNVLNTWQLVVVPITAFGALPATVKGLKVIMAGGTVGVARQWDVDYMILTNGSVPFANVPTIVFAKDSTIIASAPGVNIKQGTGMTITSALNNSTGRVDYTFNAAGGGAISVGTNPTTIYSSGLTGTGQGDTTNGVNIILGTDAGNGATSAYGVNYLGFSAGKSATSAAFSNFFGAFAGDSATNATKSNFFGAFSGQNATNAESSNFLGFNSGKDATNAPGSNFIGEDAGNAATNALSSNFIGFGSGQGSTYASQSNFIGETSGYSAVKATSSNFIGYNAGNSADNANNSIFIGKNAGNNDTVNNTAQLTYSSASGSFSIGKYVSNGTGGSGLIVADSGTILSLVLVGGSFAAADTITESGTGITATVDAYTRMGTSILIGDNTSTGGFSNSIALGKSAVNTKVNQMVVGSSTSKIDEVVFVGTGGTVVQVGTTAERPATPAQGTIRYNTTTSKFEGYDGTTWQDFY